MQTYIETSRLILRDWKEEDIPAFARMNADPHVMEFFLHPLTPEESLAFYHRIQNEFQTCGFGLYAVERKKIMLLWDIPDCIRSHLTLILLRV